MSARNNNRAFTMRPNSISCSNDYISRKKASALYANTASLNPLPGPTSKFKNINFNNGVNKGICNTNQDLYRVESVGGFNVSSYDLLQNISKGAYYTAPKGRLVSIPNNNNNLNNGSNFVNINDCSNIELRIEEDSSKKNPLNQTFNLYEGSYLIDISNSFDQNDIDCGCHPTLLGNLEDVQIFNELAKNNKDINKNSDKSLAKLAEQDPLRGFKYPNTFTIPKITIK
tara:strand:- start:921 stop:1604 length:684 start_codon:yes stop_codon:yes gene_type:complete